MSVLSIRQCLVVLAAKPVFHAEDASFGMQMARTPHPECEWTPRQKWAAYEVICRHKAELDAYGYDIQVVPRPPNPEEAKKIQVAEASGRPRITRGEGRRVQMLASGHYVVEFGNDSQALAAFQRLPNRLRTFDEKNRYWKVKFNLQSLEGDALVDFRAFLRKFKFVGPLPVVADVKQLLEKAVEQAAEREAAYQKSFALAANIELPPLGVTPRGFQKAGVAYILERMRVILADEQGLGKSGQALAAMECKMAFPALIVCKSALVSNWLKEIQMWLPNRRATRDPDDMEYRHIEILVLSYDMLVRRYEKLEDIDWRAVIVDEGQYIKNANAKRTQACCDIAKVSKAPLRMVLTGTPIETTHYDLYPQLRFLDQLNAMGGSDHFYKYFCGSDRSGSQNGLELNRLLRKVCYIRREKKDVLTELPAKQRSYVSLDITNMEEYRKAEDDIIGWLRGEVARNPDKYEIEHDEGELVKDDSLEAKQDHVVGKAQAAEALVRIGHLKKLALDGMLENAKAWIENFIESGEKLVVFCYHREAQRQVWEMFKDIAVWTMNPAGAQAAVDRFQKDPKCKIIVCSIPADNAGHTLTAASNVVTLEPWWTSTRHDQCEDRCHRIGQRGNVMCWYLVAKGTIYEEIYKLIDARRELVATATSGTFNPEANKSIVKDLIRKLAA